MLCDNFNSGYAFPFRLVLHHITPILLRYKTMIEKSADLYLGVLEMKSSYLHTPVTS